jgi:hypothetical protein
MVFPAYIFIIIEYYCDAWEPALILYIEVQML